MEVQNETVIFENWVEDGKLNFLAIVSNCDIIASELLFIDGKIFVTYGIR